MNYGIWQFKFADERVYIMLYGHIYHEDITSSESKYGKMNGCMRCMDWEYMIEEGIMYHLF